MAANDLNGHIGNVSGRIAGAGYGNGATVFATENWARGFTSLSQIMSAWSDDLHDPARTPTSPISALEWPPDPGVLITSCMPPMLWDPLSHHPKPPPAHLPERQRGRPAQLPPRFPPPAPSRPRSLPRKPPFQPKSPRIPPSRPTRKSPP